MPLTWAHLINKRVTPDQKKSNRSWRLRKGVPFRRSWGRSGKKVVTSFAACQPEDRPLLLSSIPMGHMTTEGIPSAPFRGRRRYPRTGTPYAAELRPPSDRLTAKGEKVGKCSNRVGRILPPGQDVRRPRAGDPQRTDMGLATVNNPCHQMMRRPNPALAAAGRNGSSSRQPENPVARHREQRETRRHGGQTKPCQSPREPGGKTLKAAINSQPLVSFGSHHCPV